jgi:hypothetical protein
MYLRGDAGVLPQVLCQRHTTLFSAIKANRETGKERL